MIFQALFKYWKKNYKLKQDTENLMCVGKF